MLELESSLRDFNFAHNKSHAELANETDIQDSKEYLSLQYSAWFQKRLEKWISGYNLHTQSKIEDELAISISLRPEDSVGNVEAGSPRKVNKSKFVASSSPPE